jgi:hypothetical protein
MQFRLFAYEGLDGVPDGVQLEDAAAILPKNNILKPTGRPHFSQIFFDMSCSGWAKGSGSTVTFTA